jgi:hypothetical protein
MHVRITPASFDPAREQEVQRLVESAIIPAIKALPGFQSYEGGFDRTAGRLINITHWDTEEHASWSRDQLGDVISQVQALGVQLEPPQVYEVTAEA